MRPSGSHYSPLGLNLFPGETDFLKQKSWNFQEILKANQRFQIWLHLKNILMYFKIFKFHMPNQNKVTEAQNFNIQTNCYFRFLGKKDLRKMIGYTSEISPTHQTAFPLLSQ